jgi:DNA-binding MurR/RpiR family transcriptional regulator
MATGRDSPASPSTVTAQLRAQLQSLSPSGHRLGQVVLDDPLAIIHMTVTDFAERTGTSIATVVRFCQDIGLRGFADLKIRLAAESIPADRGLVEDVTKSDDPATVLGKVFRSTAAALTEAAGTIDPKAFTKAVELVRRADHVLFVGVGTSAPLAQDAAYRFRSAGIPAEAPHDAHVQHVAARLLRKGAVCFALSHTGQTRETLAAVTAANTAQASTIAVTSFFRSPLTKLVDVALVAGSRETDFRVEAMTSRIAHTAVLDALFVAVCLRDMERTRRAQQLTAETLTEHRI